MPGRASLVLPDLDLRLFLPVPGHTLESFPKEMAMIRDSGHEIGLHGYR